MMRTLAQKMHKKPKLISMESVKVLPIHWLWWPYVPKGAITMIFGRGGLGKSSAICEITAAITTGQPLPGQLKGAKPANVLILSAEDDASRVLKPKLLAAEADVNRVFYPEKVFTLDEQGAADVHAYIEEVGAVLTVIDPLVAYIGGGVDIFRPNETREFTERLKKAAEETDSAVVIIHHSRKKKKDDTGDDWEQALGSVDLVNATRSVLFGTRNDEGQKVFRHVKHNWSPQGRTLPFDFDGEGAFEWGEGYDEEEKKLDNQRAEIATKPREAARVFLKTVLRAGPIPALELQALAKDEGINARTMGRAAKGIAKAYPKYDDGKVSWWWKLTDSTSADINDEGAMS